MAWLRLLADGSIRNDAVFDDNGHGAVGVGHDSGAHWDLVAIVGPRRATPTNTELSVYTAVPHGDQMLTGCYGLLRVLRRHRTRLAPTDQ